jgi:photosystem II stability/assembly factor-like uncharacterized protein
VKKLVMTIVLTIFCGTILFLYQDKRVININDYPNFKVKFIDSQNGWIIGPRLHKTKDGGKSWETISYSNIGDVIRADDGPEYRKNYVQMVDKEWGWRLNPFAFNEIQYSINSGRTWDYSLKITENSTSFEYFFLSKDKGFVNTGNKFLLTKDRGATWTELFNLEGKRFRSAFFLEESNGWFISGNGEIARTSNGGETWQILKNLPTVFKIDCFATLFFITPNEGWVACENYLASTKDGGETWNKQEFYIQEKKIPINNKNNILDIFFLNNEKGWLSTREGGIALTSDGGKTWKSSTTPTNAPLSSLYFIDEYNGWAVGGFAENVNLNEFPSNVILKTEDGGLTWFRVTIPN